MGDITTPLDIVFNVERENIQWALRKVSPLGWTPADEELAIRLYVANVGWPAEKAANEAMRLGSEFIKRMKEEGR
jgi:hypothetical protein